MRVTADLLRPLHLRSRCHVIGTGMPLQDGNESDRFKAFRFPDCLESEDGFDVIEVHRRRTPDCIEVSDLMDWEKASLPHSGGAAGTRVGTADGSIRLR